VSETKRILIADDEAHVTHIVGTKLRRAGYEVDVAGDGEEALRQALESPPDLMITDLQMPYLSGFEVAMRLKADPRTSAVPILLLTARGYVLDPAELALTNIRQVMAKPFSALSLLDAVQRTLGDGESERLAA
jgi:DNA-binding response OmpR family regulator